MTSAFKPRIMLAAAVTCSVLLGSCSGTADSSEPVENVLESATEHSNSVGDNATGIDTDERSGAAPIALSASDRIGSYTLVDEAFGTMVTVAVDGEVRTIETNALPDHQTGEFPNSGNPNAISEQDLTWEFPVSPTYTGRALEVRITGVAVNGVKFEPGTAETVSCSTGEVYRIEGLQDVYNLGLDFNNAHVQPTGEYHYHGVSQMLVAGYAGDEDLVHVGFAADGHLMYYSKSGAYTPSYSLNTDARTGNDCTASGPTGSTVDIDGTTPDGTYTSDWVFTDGSGDLDQCNGTTIGGQYAYLITDDYPFVSRCLMGEATADGTGGQGPPPGGGPLPDGSGRSNPPPGQGAPPGD